MGEEVMARREAMLLRGLERTTAELSASRAREARLVEALRWVRTMYRPEADSDMVRAMDDALAPYPAYTPAEMPSDVHPQEG